MTLQRILREPMLHFLLVGLGLFFVWDRLGRRGADESRIVISQAVVDDLVRQHQATWNRPPSEVELTGLVENYVREEALYREGVALGLDRDDRMIKRRVRQKVELIAEEESTPAEVSDAELADFMARHSERFMRPAVVDVDLVLVARDATAAALLPRQLTGVPLDIVARDFGEAFAQAVKTAAIGTWAATESPYGAHRVRVTARVGASLPPLLTIRDAVAREWEHERRQRALAERYGALRDAYQIVMEASLPALEVAEARVTGAGVGK